MRSTSKLCHVSTTIYLRLANNILNIICFLMLYFLVLASRVIWMTGDLFRSGAKVPRKTEYDDKIQEDSQITFISIVQVQQ